MNLSNIVKGAAAAVAMSLAAAAAQAEIKIALDSPADLEGSGSYVFTGRVSIDDLRKRLDVVIEPQGFETVAGYILARLGRVPQQGESFEVDGLSVDVIEAERRRVHRVRFRRRSAAPLGTPA